MIRFENVHRGGEPGLFCANAETFGWQSAANRDMQVVYEASLVKQAGWKDGRLRVLYAMEHDQEELLDFSNFPEQCYDDLWKYFQHHCKVHLQRGRTVAEVSAQDFDGAMRVIEVSADMVDEVPTGSVRKKALEADLMTRVEGLRDGLDLAVSGDKQALNRVFAENGCERIGRLRLVVDTVQLEVYNKDPRWLHLLQRAATIEGVLKELGTFKSWRPSEDADSSLYKRQVMRELRRRQGLGPDDQEQGDDALVPSSSSTQQPGRLATDGLPAPPLHGLLPPGAPSPSPLVPSVQEAPRATSPPPVDVPTVQEPEPMAPAATIQARPEEDWDEEVTNPNAVRANAPDDRLRPGGTLSTSGRDTGARRVGYIFDNSVLEGWVWKRSQFLKKWRRRWMVLMPEHVATYKAKSPGSATEQVDKGAFVRVYSADGEVLQAKSFCVVAQQKKFLISKQHCYFMVCDDEAEKRQWMREIEKTLGSTRR